MYLLYLWNSGGNEISGRVQPVTYNSNLYRFRMVSHLVVEGWNIEKRNKMFFPSRGSIRRITWLLNIFSIHIIDVSVLAVLPLLIIVNFHEQCVSQIGASKILERKVNTSKNVGGGENVSKLLYSL